MCYDTKVPSSTSSFRISDSLRLKLELMAEHTGKGKNWIITQALEEFLEKHAAEALRLEARRQSLEASRHKWTDEEFWEAALAETLNV